MDKEDLQCSNSKSSHNRAQSKYDNPYMAMPIMTTSVVTLEEQVSISAKTIEDLIKSIEEQDAHFARLKTKVEQLEESSQRAVASPISQIVSDTATKNPGKVCKVHISEIKKDWDITNLHLSDMKHCQSINLKSSSCEQSKGSMRNPPSFHHLCKAIQQKGRVVEVADRVPASKVPIV